MIEIKNLDKTYHLKDKDVHAINNVSIKVEEKDVYGIIGYSGAGKSSLVRCINLLEYPDSGEINIDGIKLCCDEIQEDGSKKLKSLKGKKLNEQRKKIGMIFQHFNLLDRATVFDNVAYPLKYSKESVRLGIKMAFIVLFSTILSFIITLFTFAGIRYNNSYYECKFSYDGELDLYEVINSDYTKEIISYDERYKNIKEDSVELSESTIWYVLKVNLNGLGSNFFPNETENQIIVKAFMLDYVESFGEDLVDFKLPNRVVSYKNNIPVSLISVLVAILFLISSSLLCIYLFKPIPFYKQKHEQIKERVLELLDTVGLSDKANVYPSELSGGQKQRVAIARALANNPKVLLSDESTSALDPDATESILNLLQELNKKLGLTIILITHEMSVIKTICNKVSVMEFGCVVEEGSVYDIFANPQHSATKRFISSTSTIGKVSKLVEENSPIVHTKSNETLLKLTYHKDSVGDAIISEVSRLFNVNISITLANVDYIEGFPLGHIIVAISGSKENINNAISYFKDHKVDVEVIK